MDADKRTLTGVAYHMQVNGFLSLTDTGARTGVAWPLYIDLLGVHVISLWYNWHFIVAVLIF